MSERNERCWESAEFRDLLRVHANQPESLIEVLQKTQDLLGYLPRPALEAIAQALRVPLAKVYGVATFYSQFHLQPRGKHVIRVCLGTACHVRGGEKILRRLSEVLGIAPGETTPDRKFTLQRVACLGACGLSPVMMVDEVTYGRLSPQRAVELVLKYAAADEQVAES